MSALRGTDRISRSSPLDPLAPSTAQGNLRRGQDSVALTTLANGEAVGRRRHVGSRRKCVERAVSPTRRRKRVSASRQRVQELSALREYQIARPATGNAGDAVGINQRDLSVEVDAVA